MFWILTVLHFLVDASSVAVLVAGGFSVQRVMTYNVLAFGLQLPLGIVSDLFPWITKCAFFLSGTLLVSGLAVGAAAPDSMSALAIACTGNAIFHLAAGRHVLSAEGFRAGPVGLFISTGAVGLACGMLVAERSPGMLMAGLAFALLAAYALAFCIRAKFVCGDAVKGLAFDWRGALCLIPIFAAIVWRSWAGLFANAMVSCEAEVLVVAAAAVTLVGKIAGGYIADRVGYVALTCVSVAGSSVLTALPIEHICTYMQPH